MNTNKNMYSPYQCDKRGILCMIWCKADVEKEVRVFNQLKDVLDSTVLSVEDTISLTKRITVTKKNIEFICRQINQQILEGTVK